MARRAFDVQGAQIDTVNSFMGAIFGFFNAIIAIEYLIDIWWMSVLIIVLSVLGYSIIRRIQIQNFEPYTLIINVILSGVFSFALYERSVHIKKAISYEIFWPVSPCVIYIIWCVLLELILSRRIR